MSLVNDIDSVVDFVQKTFTTSNVEPQIVPRQPASDTFVVRFQSDSRETEARFHSLVEREYQIIYFNDNIKSNVSSMDLLSFEVMNNQIAIPIKNSLRYIRVGSFSFSQPFETENDMYGCIGVLSTEIREARDQATYQKIMNVYTRYK